MLAGLCSFLVALGMNPLSMSFLSSSFSCWQDFISCNYGTHIPTSLLAVRRGSFSASRGSLCSLVGGYFLPCPKPATAGQVCLRRPVSLTSPSALLLLHFPLPVQLYTRLFRLPLLLLKAHLITMGSCG